MALGHGPGPCVLGGGGSLDTLYCIIFLKIVVFLVVCKLSRRFFYFQAGNNFASNYFRSFASRGRAPLEPKGQRMLPLTGLSVIAPHNELLRERGSACTPPRFLAAVLA